MTGSPTKVGSLGSRYGLRLRVGPKYDGGLNNHRTWFGVYYTIIIHYGAPQNSTGTTPSPETKNSHSGVPINPNPEPKANRAK